MKLKPMADNILLKQHEAAETTVSGIILATSTKEKPETPDSTVLKNLKKAGCATYITQDCTMGVYVTLDAGEVQAKYVNW